MDPLFFNTKDDLHKWFAENYETESELILGYYKTTSGLPSVSWPDSVDVALCYGWIDGVRNSIDDKAYKIRFTKRKPSSIWSAINIAKVEVLLKAGLMTPAGIAAFNKRKDSKSGIYSHENETKSLPEEMQRKFMLNPKAWEWFNKQPPSYKKVIIHWVLSAKQEKTLASRLDKLINESHNERRIL